MNAVIKYPGAKWAIADWITDFIPKHHSYLEPFFGSGAILFTKQQSNIETVNDMDNEVVNLFECIRHDPERLAALIISTPYSRKIYDDAFTTVPTDKYEQALYFCIRCNMGHGFRTNGGKVGWKNDVQGRENSYAVNYWNKMPEKLSIVAQRLKEVQIENRPAVELISRFNYANVLIYADPPYLLETRNGKQYRHEMDEHDHEILIDALRKHKGSVILSGYESDMYNSLLKGWYKETKVSYTQTMKKKIEILWMNFEPERQMSLQEIGCAGE